MNKNLDLTIANSKPPIFWKDKEKTKQQIVDITQKPIWVQPFWVNNFCGYWDAIFWHFIDNSVF